MRLPRPPDRWFDGLLSGVFLVAAEVDLLGGPRTGSRVVEVAVVAALTVPIAWRRRAPLAVACVVMSMLILLKAIDTGFHQLSVPLVALFIVPFTVAAYESRRRAVLGLAVCVTGPCVLNAMGPGSGSVAFAIGMPIASWATGRALRARRKLAVELRNRTKHIAAEREDRERLAVADERSRIARELHAVVATTVSAMVVQTDAAQRLLDVDAVRADDAMVSIEEAGRKTLAEMRRVLGVLRDGDEAAELSPQPGVGQIHAMVDAARRGHRHIELFVQGDPGSLPASVNLGLYRILEDALTSAGEDTTQPMEIALRFGETHVQLTVRAGVASLSWPTLAMRERVALCEGEIEVDVTRLVVRLPRAFAGALA